MRMNNKNGFTIIELITVIGILLLLMGAITASVAGARQRAKVQQAISEAQQLTDAILAYENYTVPGEPSPLKEKVTGDDWSEAAEDALAFVLGKVPMPNGREGNVPVLFNGAVRGGFIRDPWGHPYRFRIYSAERNPDDQDADVGNSGSALAIPNINRIPADEVN